MGVDGVSVDDRGWRRLLASVKGLDRWSVHVGILASKGGEELEGELSLIQIAAIHEFGNINTPERSFLRRTFAVRRSELVDTAAKLCKEVITRDMPVERAYALLGQWGAAAVRRTITEGAGVPPPLAASTIAAKGSDRPLVDTGRMLNAVTYEVVGEHTDDQADVGLGDDL